MSKLIGLDFEVFGRVQGVFFRKYTQKKAKELDLKGWCMNTKHGTVIGHIEGQSSNVHEMKQWLETTGSPESSIDRAEFKNEQEIAISTFSDFSVKK
ncbi:acylphosphatase-1-like [Chelonus insularis]|uniref:acylphosphatase-1-like n=1 Tax=Chelonus insularis TaxID=460826 RepID=UPI00158E4E6E|nr:acylphosphatase-1-like [Chelonus insularis]